jgi:hypothetical protein
MDISLEVVNFRQELQRIEQEIQQIADADLMFRAQYAVDNLRIVTPVDTGEARSGWALEKTRELDNSVSAVISNYVEHIVYLNQGHSKQAPSYFVEQVLSRIGLLRSS